MTWITFNDFYPVENFINTTYNHPVSVIRCIIITHVVQHNLLYKAFLVNEFMRVVHPIFSELLRFQPKKVLYTLLYNRMNGNCRYN